MWNMTWCPSQDIPHHSIACRTAYTSLDCMSLFLKQWGHLVENHLSPKMPPRPLDPLASVYTCSVGFGGSKIWTPFKVCAYAGMYLRLNLDLNDIEKLIRLQMNVRPCGTSCAQNCRYPIRPCRSFRLQCLHFGSPEDSSLCCRQECACMHPSGPAW